MISTHEIRVVDSEIAVNLVLIMPNSDLGVAENQEKFIIDHSIHGFLFFLLVGVVFGIV